MATENRLQYRVADALIKKHSALTVKTIDAIIKETAGEDEKEELYVLRRDVKQAAEN